MRSPTRSEKGTKGIQPQRRVLRWMGLRRFHWISRLHEDVLLCLELYEWKQMKRGLGAWLMTFLLSKIDILDCERGGS